MNSLRAFFFCSALSTLVACEWFSPSPERPAPIDAGLAKQVARLESVKGSVAIERDGVRRSAAREPLYAGDLIETGENGSAVLHFTHGRVVELSSNGSYEINIDGSGVMLNVAKGVVLTRVKAAEPDETGEVLLSISTPFGLTRIGSAEMSMSVNDTSVSVEVNFGDIELVSRSGEVTTLGAGEKRQLGSVRELPEIALLIIASSGKAELKAKDTKRFVAINSKKLATLNSGDTIRVREGTVSLGPQGSNTRLSLLKGAEVGFQKTQKQTNEEATALELNKGELEVSAPAGQVTRLAIASGVTVVSAAGGQYAIKKTPTGIDLDAWAGDVTVERANEGSTLVPGGQRASIPTQGSSTVLKAFKDSLVLPSRQGLRVFHTSLRRVSLSWEDAPEETGWRVQLATDANFTAVVRDGVVHENFITVPMPPKGQWHWVVWRKDVQHAKGSVSFAKEQALPDLSRLKNVVVDGADTTTIYYQDKDKPPVVTFSWNAHDEASKYSVKVYREGQLSSPVAVRAVTQTQVSLPENSLLEGKYLWSLTPIDSKGNELSGGKMNRLHLVYDNAVTGLRIKGPKEGDLGKKMMPVTGVAPVGSRLFINGKSIPLDEQARFDTRTSPLSDGRLIFRLLHDGSEIYTVRTVRIR